MIIPFSVGFRSGGAALDEAHDIGLGHDHRVLAVERFEGPTIFSGARGLQ
jgi:hypothetical protein